MKQTLIVLALFALVGSVKGGDDSNWFIKSGAKLSGVQRTEKGQVKLNLQTWVEGRNELHSVWGKPVIVSLQADGKEVKLPKSGEPTLLPGHNAKQDHVITFDGVPADAKTISFTFKVKGGVWMDGGKLEIPVTSKKEVTAGVVKLKLDGVEKDDEGYYKARVWLGTTKMYEVPQFVLVDTNGKAYEVESQGAVDSGEGVAMTVKFKKDSKQAAPATLRIIHKGTPLFGEMEMTFKNVTVFNPSR